MRKAYRRGIGKAPWRIKDANGGWERMIIATK
jgi:hypothetical protein